nr:hypothetical protein BgiMline_028088 [Biomphalaria glabrata]
MVVFRVYYGERIAQIRSAKMKLVGTLVYIVLGFLLISSTILAEQNTFRGDDHSSRYLGRSKTRERELEKRKINEGLYSESRELHTRV